MSRTWDRIEKLVRGGNKIIVRSLDAKAKSKEDLSAEDRRFLDRYFAAVDRLDLPDHLVELLPGVLRISRQATGKWPRISNLRRRLESERDEINYYAELDAIEDAYGWGGQD